MAECYVSAVGWLRVFQSWGIDTELRYSSIDDAHGRIVQTTRFDEKPVSPHGFWNSIIGRFAQDVRSLFLIVWVQLIGFVFFDVSWLLAYYSVARPFVLAHRIEYQLPDRLPPRLIVANHHRPSIVDQELYSMFFVGQMYDRFRVLQAHGPKLSEAVLLKTYGAILFLNGNDPHWTIAQELRAEVPKPSAHEVAVVLFPDRDGQLYDDDTDIAFGLGAYASSLAFQVPILDLRTFTLLDEASKVVYVKGTLVHPPLGSVQVFRESADFAAWRTEHAKEIQSYACKCRDEFLKEMRRDIARPMCAQFMDPSNDVNVGRYRRNASMVARYRC